MNQRPSYEIELEYETGNRRVEKAVDYGELKEIVVSCIFFVSHMTISKCVDGKKELYKDITVKWN